MTMTDEEIQISQDICDAATEGPWVSTKFYDTDDHGLHINFHAKYPDGEDTSLGRERDTIFTAHARTALPAALEDIRRWRHHIANTISPLDAYKQGIARMDDTNQKLLAENKELRKQIAELNALEEERFPPGPTASCTGPCCGGPLE
jgi:hypothetical protein